MNPLPWSNGGDVAYQFTASAGGCCTWACRPLRSAFAGGLALGTAGDVVLNLYLGDVT